MLLVCLDTTCGWRLWFKLVSKSSSSSIGNQNANGIIMGQLKKHTPMQSGLVSLYFHPYHFPSLVGNLAKYEEPTSWVTIGTIIIVISFQALWWVPLKWNPSFLYKSSFMNVESFPLPFTMQKCTFDVWVAGFTMSQFLFLKKLPDLSPLQNLHTVPVSVFPLELLWISWTVELDKASVVGNGASVLSRLLKNLNLGQEGHLKSK